MIKILKIINEMYPSIYIYFDYKREFFAYLNTITKKY